MEPQQTDRDWLCGFYESAEPLNAKFEVLREFRVASEPFESWLLANAELDASDVVLDVGCGGGRFLFPAAEHVVDGLVVGCDLSPGVISELVEKVRSRHARALGLVADASNLPFVDETFDVVMCNHMLYHVPDITGCLNEARRVLRTGGRFVATTNAAVGMPEFYEIYLRTARALGLSPIDVPLNRFSVESGREYVDAVFGNVDVKMYEGGFLARDPRPIVQYFKSTQLFREPIDDATLGADVRAAIEPTFSRYADAAIQASGGALLVSKPMGAFFATKT